MPKGRKKRGLSAPFFLPAHQSTTHRNAWAGTTLPGSRMGWVGSLGGSSTISSGVSGEGGMTGGGLPGGTSEVQMWLVMVFFPFNKMAAAMRTEGHWGPLKGSGRWGGGAARNARSLQWLHLPPLPSALIETAGAPHSRSVRSRTGTDVRRRVFRQAQRQHLGCSAQRLRQTATLRHSGVGLGQQHGPRTGRRNLFRQLKLKLKLKVS